MTCQELMGQADELLKARQFWAFLKSDSKSAGADVPWRGTALSMHPLDLQIKHDGG